MSTNKSEHLKLHLWEPEDDFLRTEFNENFSALDEAVKTVTAAVSKAQSTADTARSEGAELPYVVGSYVGTGAELTITLGFRASFLILSGMKESAGSNNTSVFDRYFGMTAGNLPMDHRITLTQTGFTVYPTPTDGYYHPAFSDKGRVYNYIAFK